MNITVSNQTVSVPQGMSAGGCLEAAGVDLQDVFAALRGSVVLELNDAVHTDCTLHPLTIADEEGRRIYDRSLRFVLLLAIRRLLPGIRVRIEYSVGYGFLVRLPEHPVDQEELDRIAAEMHRIVEENLPFVRKTWKLADAIEYFEKDGQPDKVELLRLRPYDFFTMYSCGGMWEYFYGAMAPSTGSVPYFALVRSGDGFVLQMPSAASPKAPAPFLDRPKHLAVFAQSAEWCRILGVSNTADLTHLLRQGAMRDFIRVNEALHDKAIAGIADEIHRSGRRVILIAGPSSSGKTTFCRRLGVHLRVLGYHPVLLGLDDFYLDRDAIPPEPNGELDLESIHTLDLPLLQQMVNELLAGTEVELPVFNFLTGKRDPVGRRVRLADGEPILIEGIHGLNPMLSEGMPAGQLYRIFVSALTCLNLDDHNRIRTTDVRLLRRIVRDRQFRGSSPEETLSMWPSVRRGENTWIFPWQEQADCIFNTALHYELPFLKSCAGDFLSEISQDNPVRLQAERIMKILHYVPNIPKEYWNEIPPTSILREFIGGLSFDS